MLYDLFFFIGNNLSRVILAYVFSIRFILGETGVFQFGQFLGVFNQAVTKRYDTTFMKHRTIGGNVDPLGADIFADTFTHNLTVFIG